jgi:hypothetical protein
MCIEKLSILRLRIGKVDILELGKCTLFQKYCTVFIPRVLKDSNR